MVLWGVLVFVVLVVSAGAVGYVVMSDVAEARAARHAAPASVPGDDGGESGTAAVERMLQ